MVGLPARHREWSRGDETAERAEVGKGEEGGVEMGYDYGILKPL